MANKEFRIVAIRKYSYFPEDDILEAKVEVLAEEKERCSKKYIYINLVKSTGDIHVYAFPYTNMYDSSIFALYIGDTREKQLVAQMLLIEKKSKDLATEFFCKVNDIESAIITGEYVSESEEWNIGNNPTPKNDMEYLVTIENSDKKRATQHELYHVSDQKWDMERDDFSEWRVVAWKKKIKPFQK